MAQQKNLDAVFGANSTSLESFLRNEVFQLGARCARRIAWRMICRAAAAVLGGYALTATATLLAARVLPLPPVEAVTTAMMLSFALYAAIIIWAFTARSVRHVWLVLTIGSAACEVLAWFAREVHA